MTEFDKLVKMVKDDNANQMDIMVKKNHDYAGENPEDPMANFNLVETMLGISAEMGLMVRILDKENRIANFLKTGVLNVADEKIDDTIDDSINYHRLLKFRIQQRREAKKCSDIKFGIGVGMIDAAETYEHCMVAKEEARDIEYLEKYGFTVGDKVKIITDIGLSKHVRCNDVFIVGSVSEGMVYCRDNHWSVPVSGVRLYKSKKGEN